MKHIIALILTIISFISFAQEENKELLLAAKKANNFVYQGNELIESQDYVLAEMEYRKAISEKPTTEAAAYNLGTSYYKSGNFDESLYRLQQATKTATSKPEKHKAFHNIGNILMQNKKCKEAVEAYKNALRNNPSDNETRYNLSVAKICAEEQQKQDDQNKDDKQDNQDQNDENKENQDNKDKENQDKEGEDKEDKKDEGDQDKKEGEDEKDDEGKPKDEKKDDKKENGKGDEDKKKEQQKPQPQPGQLSPQQIKNLLEAMNNQEQKVQEKMNAEKQKGVKIKTEKDW
ncbi:tetratricopeptide repeat protein [uncultured Algibacter sp.]|uniref:tetratricopeptide repeat protein n=1 Tax=uncultured Algibacter sp. TaxID=298659 RepID=UPI00262C4988|nr:tetratricopeptide repeat protein [uncultured Algibacter sp.]